jgi:methyl-accepting chemotaxis protein
MNGYLIALILFGASMIGVTVYMAWVLRRSDVTHGLLERRMGEVQQQLEQIEQVFEQAIPRAVTDTVPKEIFRGIRPLIGEVHQLTTQVRDGVAPLAQTMIQTQGQMLDAAQRFSASSVEIKQISDRFVSMADDLRRTQSDLQRAVQLLAEPEKLQDWLLLLQETVRPLQSVNESLSQHHNTSAQLLLTTGTLLNHWGAQGEALANYAGRMEGLLQRWNTEELLSRRRSEDKVSQGMHELSQKNAEIANNFLELQGAIKKQTTTVDTLQRAMEQAGTLLNQIVDAQRQAHSDQQQGIEELRRLGQSLARHEQILGTQLVQLAEHVRKLSEVAQHELVALQKQSQTTLTTTAADIQRLMKILQSRYDQTMDGLQSYQQEMLEHQGKLIQRASRAVDQLPTRQLQWAQTIVMVAIAVLIALLLWLR